MLVLGADSIELGFVEKMRTVGTDGDFLTGTSRMGWAGKEMEAVVKAVGLDTRRIGSIT